LLQKSVTQSGTRFRRSTLQAESWDALRLHPDESGRSKLHGVYLGSSAKASRTQ